MFRLFIADLNLSRWNSPPRSQLCNGSGQMLILGEEVGNVMINLAVHAASQPPTF